MCVWRCHLGFCETVTGIFHYQQHNESIMVIIVSHSQEKTTLNAFYSNLKMRIPLIVLAIILLCEFIGLGWYNIQFINIMIIDFHLNYTAVNFFFFSKAVILNKLWLTTNKRSYQSFTCIKSQKVRETSLHYYYVLYCYLKSIHTDFNHPAQPRWTASELYVLF